MRASVKEAAGFETKKADHPHILTPALHIPRISLLLRMAMAIMKRIFVNTDAKG